MAIRWLNHKKLSFPLPTNLLGRFTQCPGRPDMLKIRVVDAA